MQERNYVQVAAVLKLLSTIVADPTACGKPLRDELQVSKPKLYRLLKAARQDFGVDIKWKREAALPNKGRYIIRDWGVLDRKKVANLGLS